MLGRYSAVRQLRETQHPAAHRLYVYEHTCARARTVYSLGIRDTPVLCINALRCFPMACLCRARCLAVTADRAQRNGNERQQPKNRGKRVRGGEGRGGEGNENCSGKLNKFRFFTASILFFVESVASIFFRGERTLAMFRAVGCGVLTDSFIRALVTRLITAPPPISFQQQQHRRKPGIWAASLARRTRVQRYFNARVDVAFRVVCTEE